MLGVLLIAGSVALYCVKSLCNKIYALAYKGPDGDSTCVFSIICGIGCALATWLVGGCAFSPTKVTWIMGLVNGVALFLFNMAVINSSVTGPYSFQSLMSTAGNILLPLLFSCLWMGDSLSMVQLVGIILMLASFVLFNAKGLHFDGAKKGYFFWVTLQFASNGLYGILFDAQQRATQNTQRNEMIIVTFLTCTVISIVYLLIKEKGAIVPAFRMGKRAWGTAIATTVIYTAATNFMVIALAHVQSAILYTAINGGVLVLSVLLGSVIFKEKFTFFKGMGLAVAVASLILLGI